MKNKISSILVLLLFCASCVTNADFDTTSANCVDTSQNRISFEDLEDFYSGEVIQIQEDLELEGYVVSSDRAGNFFSSLFIQNDLTNPTHSLQLEIDLRESHLVFEKGRKISIRLKGLYLGKSDEILKLGGTFLAFGNISVGRLPSLKIPEHVFLQCGDVMPVQPVLTEIGALPELPPGVLVQLEDMEVADSELGKTFAEKEEETLRILQNCEEVPLLMRNSGFADFQEEPLPSGRGSITGILLKDGNDFHIAIRDLDDIRFIEERCPEIITEFTSDQIFISELADPDNNSGARFVELYYAGTEPLDLNLWTLTRYTNDNTEASSSIDLSGILIEGGSTLVISPNPEEFELVYGFPPDVGVSTNSPADSNGDDNLELVDPFGKVIDVFGIIGEDGSGTNHEFEDGRALRKTEIIQGNPVYTFEEWTIYNDSGEAGTINQPQKAPENFSPGIKD